MLIRPEKVYDGDIHPIAANNSGEQRAENQRVEVSLYQKVRSFKTVCIRSTLA
jgi:hypothetical protein